MTLLRWLGVALLSLATTGAVHAQTASFSMLGLTTLFGQDVPAPTTSTLVPWLPMPAGNFGFTIDIPFTLVTEATSERPLPGCCAFSVPDCLMSWKKQWSLGNFREAQRLAAIACRIDPSNVTAQHARVLAEFMQGLAGTNNHVDGCVAASHSETCTECVEPVRRSTGCDCGQRSLVVHQTEALEEDIATLLAILRRLHQHSRTSSSGCGCAAPTKAEVKACACAAAAKAEAKACACTAQADACCCSKKAPVAKKAAKCGCGGACACCKCAVSDKKVRLLQGSPFAGLRQGPLPAPGCPLLEGLQTILAAPLSAPGAVPGPVVMVPPIYVPSPIALTPPPAPPRAPVVSRHPLPPPPSPVQALQDLECARAAALSQARSEWQSADSARQPVARSNVHLVTPHLEAHCERLVSDGNPDHIVLEGDVRLTVRRNGQAVRIQGQRVQVRLSDGTFAIEGGVALVDFGQPVPPPRVAVPPLPYMHPVTYTVPQIPRDMVRPVRPSQRMPAEEHED